MMPNTMSRRTALVAAAGTAAAVAGPSWMPAAAAAPRTAAPRTAVAGEVIRHPVVVNPSFEEPVVDGVIPGWQPYSRGESAPLSVVDSLAHTGSHSLRIADTSGTTGSGLQSDPFEVTPGTTYRFQVWAHVEGSPVNLFAYFFDAAGAQVAATSTILRSSTAGWVKGEVTATAPANGVTAAAMLYSTTVGVTTTHFDDVSVEAIVGVETSLGEPIVGLTSAGTGYTERADGTPVVMVSAGGAPGRLSILDAATGARLASHDLPAVATAWAWATGSDRAVFVSGQGGGIYRVDPDALTAELLVKDPAGETYLWDLLYGDDDVLYVATYPNGKVLAIDPSDGTVLRDYGQLMPGADYVRSFGWLDGKIYGGTGTVARLVELDTVTGESVVIDLPEAYRDEQFVYDVDVAGELVFVRVTPSNTMLVYDPARREWVGEVADVLGLSVSSASRRQQAYFVGAGGQVRSYHLASGKVADTPLNLNGAASRGFAWVQLPQREFPGDSLVTADSKARIWALNPITNAVSMVEGDAVGTPFKIRSVGTGPDGNIYVGGYLSPTGMARIDADTQESTLLRGASQIEGMTAYKDWLIFGEYPAGVLYSFDVTQPWSDGDNPGTPVTIGYGQQRPAALTPAGDKVAVGTVPDYGHLDGGLSLFDPATGEISVYPNVVPDQTPLSLVHHDGLIYGGTGIWGGLGVDPTTTEGHLFIFDPVAAEVVHSVVPVPGEQNVSALVVDDAGMLWGLTGNVLFRFDPASREVTLRRRYFSIDDSADYVRGRSLYFHDGRFVGATAGSIFEINPATLDMTVLATRADNLAIDRNGSYYYRRGSELFRWSAQ